MGTILAIFQAIRAALAVWNQERAIYNRPDLVKGKLEEQQQQLRDHLNNLDMILADPKATPADHAEALRQIRLADS